MKIAGIVLLALGALALLYGGFRYTTRDRVLDLGPVQIDADRTHSVPIAPLAGVLAMVAGAAMLFNARHRV